MRGMRGEHGPDTRSGPNTYREHCEPKADGRHHPGGDELRAEPQPGADPSAQP